MAVFNGRAAEAEQLGRTPRHWPPTIVGHEHWINDYARAAASGGINLSLNDAVAEVNAWIAEIDASGERGHARRAAQGGVEAVLRDAAGLPVPGMRKARWTLPPT